MDGINSFFIKSTEILPCPVVVYIVCSIIYPVGTFSSSATDSRFRSHVSAMDRKIAYVEGLQKEIPISERITGILRIWTWKTEDVVLSQLMRSSCCWVGLPLNGTASGKEDNKYGGPDALPSLSHGWKASTEAMK